MHRLQYTGIKGATNLRTTSTRQGVLHLTAYVTAVYTTVLVVQLYTAVVPKALQGYSTVQLFSLA